MQRFVSFWYLSSGAKALTWLKVLIAGFEGNLAVATTAKNLGKPLFQDYTLQGRFIGFGFRIVRIIFGGLFYSGIAAATAFAYLLWLAFPILCLTAILGSFLGPSLPNTVPTELGDTWIR
jgi:hypothetical protein